MWTIVDYPISKWLSYKSTYWLSNCFPSLLPLSESSSQGEEENRVLQSSSTVWILGPDLRLHMTPLPWNSKCSLGTAVSPQAARGIRKQQCRIESGVSWGLPRWPHAPTVLLPLKCSYSPGANCINYSISQLIKILYPYFRLESPFVVSLSPSPALPKMG